MSFQTIASKNPSSFYRREIARAYRQMNDSSVDKPKGTILDGRYHRAHLLCQFLDWYLSLPRNDEQIRWLRENIPFTERIVPQIYEAHANRQHENEALVTARVAYRRIFHLHSTESAVCDLCLRDLLFHDRFSRRDSAGRQLWMEANAAHVVKDLISVTKYVFSHPIEDLSRLENALQQAISFIRADKDPLTTFGPLRAALSAGTLVYPLVQSRWRDVLNATIDEQHAMRTQRRTVGGTIRGTIPQGIQIPLRRPLSQERR